MRPTLATNINYGAGGGIYPNLLSAGPPFQIDGNFGTTAGIAEMLIQSHAGFIDLLPALPDAWKPAGSVTGLKARGNYTVDLKWKNGRVTTYHIKSLKPCTVQVRMNGGFKWVKIDSSLFEGEDNAIFQEGTESDSEDQMISQYRKKGGTHVMKVPRTTIKVE
jgi:alpha-L-fucosidase 2